MTPDAFRSSTSQSKHPENIPAPLAAMWWAAKGDWDRAHKIVQDEDSADAAWVHAYLHRVEGDLSNARYWYRQATRAVATGPLDTEWSAIVEALFATTSKA
jgi:hypothetical protein